MSSTLAIFILKFESPALPREMAEIVAYALELGAKLCHHRLGDFSWLTQMANKLWQESASGLEWISQEISSPRNQCL
jgi:hypothetical protein